MAGSNLVIELPDQLSRRSHYQRVPTRKLSHRCGTMTEPCWPNKSMKPWLMGRLQCAVVHWPIADMRGESRDVRFLGWSEPKTDGSARSAFVESPGGISPLGAPRTVHEPLDSHGSRCSALDMHKAPVCEERWICAVNALQPSRTVWSPAQTLEFPACPANQEDVKDCDPH
jgi:hypothetical protein